MTRPEDANRRNLLLLVQLRWLAVAGQLATILLVQAGLGVALPILPMFAVLGLLIALNLAQLLSERRRAVTNAQLLAALLLDVAALGTQLYLSGGATNPFIALFLLQVVLGAVLLRAWSSWLLAGVASAAFAGLAIRYRPLPLPADYASVLSPLHLLGAWFAFTLAAGLLVLFVARVTRNLSERDARLATMRQRAAEEEHIVRMGLLASGAAHELGTPLASVAVALGDWSREPAIRDDPALAAEVAEIGAEVARCKEILARVLSAAGEVSGEAPERTSLRRFVGAIVADRQQVHPGRIAVADRLERDRAIVADRALAQALANLLDNAVEAGAMHVELTLAVERGILCLEVRDDGAGFPPAILAHLGEPYRSSKDRRAAGLGLFLATNVLRVLGGEIRARNREEGGAIVTLRLPLAAIALDGP